MFDRLRYWRRIAAAYGSSNSALTFWHETPEAHPGARYDAIGPYYQTFADKARYPGPFDAQGVPLLDYHGSIGRRYNPIAVAQYGLARFNRFLETGDAGDRAAFLAQADWLCAKLTPNARGLHVWNHDFDFEYRSGLKAPWYSGLAQGQGLSLLARALKTTGDARYAGAMDRAFEPLRRTVDEGGVLYRDGEDVWIEEYVVEPPSHILNGFLWALWGVKDHALATGSAEAGTLFADCAATAERALPRYDTGSWSTYEASDTWIPMVTSGFYHRLHIVQLEITAAMTGRPAFAERARRWRGYWDRPVNRKVNLARKVAFKLLYY